MTHGEKDVIVLDGSDDEAVKNGDEEKERRKTGCGGNCSEGRHFSTKAEAYQYLSDLSNFPSLANWLAFKARETAERRLRRAGKSKKRRGKKKLGGMFPVQEAEGVEESKELRPDKALVSKNGGAQLRGVDDTEKGCIESTSKPEEGTEPTDNGDVLESTSASDLYLSRSEREDGPANEGNFGAPGLAALKDVAREKKGVAENASGDDTEKGYTESASKPGERSEPTGNDNVLESASASDLYLSHLERADGTANEGKPGVLGLASSAIDIYLSCSERDDGTANEGNPGVPGLAALKDAAKEEKMVAENASGNDTREGCRENTSKLGEETEATGNDEVSESASAIDLYLSCSERENGNANEGNPRVPGSAALKDASKKEKLVAKNAFVDVMVKGEQTDIITALETMTPLEAQSVDRKDKVPVKHRWASRYFDTEESIPKLCYKCGEDDHIPSQCTAPKKRKTCFICGGSGHDGMRCKQVNECFFCGRRGHLAKDCPQEDIVREQRSSFCLRCRDLGHDMFSCNKEYPSDDLEKIQCYVCKAFGHLCCVSDRKEGPRSVSCYKCGECGHLGSECMKLPESSNGSESNLGQLDRGGRGRRRNKRKRSKKAKIAGKAPSVLTQERSNVSGVKFSPRRFDRSSKSKVWHNNRINGRSTQWRGGLNYIPGQGLFYPNARSNVWLSPMEAARRKSNFSRNFTSSSQSLDQRPQ